MAEYNHVDVPRSARNVPSRLPVEVAEQGRGRTAESLKEGVKSIMRTLVRKEAERVSYARLRSCTN